MLSERLEIQIKMFESVKGGVISEIDGYRQTIESPSSLVLDPNNAKVHTEHDLEMIGHSLNAFGFRKNAIAVQEKTRIVYAGNGMVQGLIANGINVYPVIVISEFRCYFFDGLKGKPVASTTLFSKGGDTKDKPISMFRSVVAVVPTSKAKAFCVRRVVRRFVLTALPISFRNAWVTCTPLCIMSSGVVSGVAITTASTDWVSVNAGVCLFCLEG